MKLLFINSDNRPEVFVGEVSQVNDDYVDNDFYGGVGRFDDIEEDLEPLHLLYGDYARYCKV